MYKTIFRVSEMDCPSEETMIRTKFDGLISIKELEFDIENRKLIVFHSEEDKAIEASLNELKLGSKWLHTEKVNDIAIHKEDNKVNRNCCGQF